MLLTQKPLLVAVARLITKLSAPEQGVLRLYTYYKRSRRHPIPATTAEQLAGVIRSELQLLTRSEAGVRRLAMAMQHQIRMKKYSEDYFVELAVWITRLHAERIQ